MRANDRNWPTIATSHGKRAVLAVLLLLGGVACRAPFRYAAVDTDPSRLPDSLLLERLDPFLLTNLVSDEIVVEVDHVEGLAPSTDALEALVALLREGSGTPKDVELKLDDEIPREAWDAAPGKFDDKLELLGSYLDEDPESWEDRELVYVVYAPGDPGMMGWTTSLTVPRLEVPTTVRTVFLFPEAMRRQASLWIQTRKIERAIAVHEAGHVLGLVADPDHEVRDDPRHCTEPDCVMSPSRFRSQLYNALPALFAGKVRYGIGLRCREDLERARTAWAERAAHEPGLADEWIRRRRSGELRSQACWYAQQRRWPEALQAFAASRQLRGDPPASDDVASLAVEQICAD